MSNNPSQQQVVKTTTIGVALAFYIIWSLIIDRGFQQKNWSLHSTQRRFQLKKSIQPINNLLNMTFKECVNIVDNEKNKRYQVHLFDTTPSSECSSKFKYCSSNTPFLFSYGGSGNTVTRIIISYITNIYTGSIYPGARAYAIFRRAGYFLGEGHCGNKQQNDIVIIKAHPSHLNMTKMTALFNGNCTINDCMCFSQDGNMQKRISNQILYHKNDEYNPFYVNAIFIIRNPWHAIWALYEFSFGSGCGLNDDRFVHVRHVYTKSIPECKIPRKRLWKKHHFEKTLIEEIPRWLNTFKLMKLMDLYAKKYIAVKFENLVNLKNPLIAMNEMDKMMKYLYLEGYYDGHRLELIQRMECLTTLFMPIDWKRFGKVHRTKPDPLKNQVTIQDAYESVDDEIICRVWSNIKMFAVKYGYSIWNDTDCGSVESVQ